MAMSAKAHRTIRVMALVALGHVLIVDLLASTSADKRPSFMSESPLRVELVSLPAPRVITPSKPFQPPPPPRPARPKPTPSRSQTVQVSTAPAVAASPAAPFTEASILAPTQSQNEPYAKPSEQRPPSPTPVVRMPQSDAAYLNNPPPPYPRLSRRLGEQGVVLLRVWVSADGIPERVEMRQNSGSPRLDQSALDTVPRWRFVPGLRDGQPQAMWVQVPIRFLLD